MPHSPPVSASSSSTGVGFTGLLALLLIGLKLTGVITWSWWWVLAPLWIGCLIVLFSIAVLIVITIVTAD